MTPMILGKRKDVRKLEKEKNKMLVFNKMGLLEISILLSLLGLNKKPTPSSYGKKKENGH